MPTYDYECTKCGHTFEVFHDINSVSKERCPHCRGKAQKLISGGSGLIFKGSGFYITDYKKKSSQDAAVKPKEKSSSGNRQPKDKPSQESDTTRKKES